jgi:putative ABC transport system permease protein
LKRKDLSVIGLPRRSRLVAFDIAHGEGLDASADSVVVNTALYAELAEPAMGADIVLGIDGYSRRFRLAGVAREPFSSPAAFVARTSFGDRPESGRANTLRISFMHDDPASLQRARADVDMALERSGIRAVQATTPAESRYSIDEHMAMIYAFLLVVAAILGTVGTLGLVTTVSLNITERRREMGILRAIGATPAQVALMVVAEAVFVGVLAWLFATLAAAPLSEAVGDFLLHRMMGLLKTELAVATDWSGVVIWLAIALVASALAGFVPARQAARTSVRDALTYE